MTGKTLKELNVQVGDVVECVSAHGDWLKKGKTYTVDHDMRVVGHDITSLNVSTFRIISRATKYTDWKFGTAPDGADTHVMPDGSVAWRVKVEPKVERVVLFGCADEYSPHVVTSDTHCIIFTTIDGVPDCASVKMEVLCCAVLR